MSEPDNPYFPFERGCEDCGTPVMATCCATPFGCLSLAATRSCASAASSTGLGRHLALDDLKPDNMEPLEWWRGTPDHVLAFMVSRL